MLTNRSDLCGFTVDEDVISTGGKIEISNRLNEDFFWVLDA